MVALTDETTFGEYVYQDNELVFSDIRSNLIRISPEYTGGNSWNISYKSLVYVARQAHKSITCYRALEWWSVQPDYFMLPDIKRYARFCLSVIEKPKQYPTLFLITQNTL